MNIIVTGGQGFIGQHLVKELSKKHNVTTFDLVDGQDVTDAEQVMEAFKGQDFCFHLAGMLGTHELVSDTAKAVKINIGGTVNVLDACVKHGVKLIEISKPNVWVNTYSITKDASEQFTEMYRRELGLKASVVKWFNVYGTGQPLFEEAGYKKAIPTWIVDGLKGRPIEIYGNGHQTVDLVHTADTVDSVIAMMDNFEVCEGKTYEVGADEVELNEVAEMIRDLTGGRSEISNVPMRAGETPDTKLKADIRPLFNDTGWKPKVSLEDGLKECINYYNKKYVETDNE